MKRVIKFRGKRIDNGEWIYGDLIQDIENNRYAVVPQKTGWHTYDLFEVDPDTVGQFTGLTDKYGREVFEGDVVRIGLGDELLDGTIEYFTAYAGFCKTTVLNDVWELNEDDNIEVIGTIHDTKPAT